MLPTTCCWARFSTPAPPLQAVQAAIDAVAPEAVALSHNTVTRAGLRATRLTVSMLRDERQYRTWRDVQRMLARAALDDAVRSDAEAVFRRLASAEARVHGIEVDDVHFHEVGALDSIADIVGTCSAIRELGVSCVVASAMALGSGQVSTAHGTLAVPVPAVMQMADGWTVSAGGVGELATPTGVAIVTTLAGVCGPLPEMRVHAVGIGAGARDTAGRANVVRVVVGEPAASNNLYATSEVVLEANVDDVDPRVWPSVLAALMSEGANDAWLTPILMKNGRPAHTLHVLAANERVEGLQRVIFAHTSTMGLRRILVSKYALARTLIPVQIAGGTVRIKLAFEDDVILQATVEFDHAQDVARRSGTPV